MRALPCLSRLVPLLSLALLSACAEPFSNEVFEEDARFLSALPTLERSTVDFRPGSVSGGKSLHAASLPEGVPDLRGMTEEISGSLNGLATDMLETVDLVRSLSPTEREEDARRWGPWPVSQLGGAFLLVEIVRRGGDQYDWSFGLAEVEAGPFVDVFTGTHLAGSSVALGDGAFSWDLDALAGVTGLLASGRLDVDYDNRVGTEFLMDLQDLSFPGMTRTLDADYWYHQDEASKGDFEYETSGDVGGGAAREDVEARTRWTEGGEGRSDARVSGGDLAEAITISECWDATGDLVYLVDTHGLFEGIGEPGACAFLEPALPEHIEAR